MKHLHEAFLMAAYAVFVIAMAWDFFAPRVAYTKTIRHIILKSLRKKTKP